MNKKQIERYSRQIIIKNIGPLGQKKILKSKVLIIGAGGLGCPAIDILVRAGVGKIGVIDNDRVHLSNIHRQNLYDSKDINKYKVDVIKKKIFKINPNIKLKTYKMFIDKKNAKKIIKPYDIILEGSDNFETKFLVNRICISLKKKLIVGAISKFDGHIFGFDFSKEKTPCLKCFYQSYPSNDTLNCEFDGVVGTISNLVGSVQSNEVIKFILNIGESLVGKILIIDLFSLNFRSTKFSKKRNCECR